MFIPDYVFIRSERFPDEEQAYLISAIQGMYVTTYKTSDNSKAYWIQFSKRDQQLMVTREEYYKILEAVKDRQQAIRMLVEEERIKNND